MFYKNLETVKIEKKILFWIRHWTKEASFILDERRGLELCREWSWLLSILNKWLR